MADVIRELRDNEEGLFMPCRELLEPATTEVKVAVAQFVASLIDMGVKKQSGEVLVAVNDSLQVTSSYFINIVE